MGTKPHIQTPVRGLKKGKRMRYIVLISATIALVGCSGEKPKNYNLDVKCKCECPQDADKVQENSSHIPEILIA